MSKLESTYVNTDFDLRSKTSFDELHAELSEKCSALHYACDSAGHYTASFESDHEGDSGLSGVRRDISLMLDATRSLSLVAKHQLAECHLREFNIGFDCGDSFGFVYQIDQETVDSVSNAACTLAVTLYPMRHPDGTPRCC